MFRFVKDFAQNTKTLLRALALRRVELGDVKADFPTVILMFLAYAMVYAALDYPWGDPMAIFSDTGFAIFASVSLCFLIVCIFCAVLLGLRTQAADIYALLLTLLIFLEPVSHAFETTYWDPTPLAFALWLALIAFMVWSVFAIVFALSPGRLRTRIPRAAAFVVLCISASMFLGTRFPEEPLFFSSADLEEDEDYAEVDTESVYYQQPTLMSEQLNGLALSEPGQVDLFVLAAGGYAYQRVFAREVEAVPGSLAAQFGSERRQVQLLNSVMTPDLYPLANRTNLEHAFSAMAERMQDEDVALIYLTSHGYPHEFSLNFWEMRLQDLTSAQLAKMLDRSGLKNVVIVISACYSGSFIDALKAEDRMIVTASSDSATSFGCSDESEWTWFGRAFFEQSLPKNPDFRQAFELARAQVAKWEAQDGLEPSDPQIWVGDGINAVLDQFHAYQSARAE